MGFQERNRALLGARYALGKDFPPPDDGRSLKQQNGTGRLFANDPVESCFAVRYRSSCPLRCGNFPFDRPGLNRRVSSDRAVRRRATELKQGSSRVETISA